MDTTIRISSHVKQQLKLKSVELGVTQKELANRYILYCLKIDNTPDTISSTEDIEKQLNISVENKFEKLNNNFEIPEMLKLKKDNKQEAMKEEDIINLLDHDKPEGETILDELTGLVSSPTPTNSVNLKKCI